MPQWKAPNAKENSLWSSIKEQKWTIALYAWGCEFVNSVVILVLLNLLFLFFLSILFSFTLNLVILTTGCCYFSRENSTEFTQPVLSKSHNRFSWVNLCVQEY